MATEYQVLTDSSKTGLEVQVAQLVKTDWQPIGGVTVTVDKHGAPTYYQAMIR